MPVVVAYADTEPGHAALRYAATMASTLGEDIVLAAAEHDAQTSIERAREVIGPVDTMPTITAGESELHDPSDRVIQIAQSVGASHIILGLRHRSAVGKLLLGSTAQRILLAATCPVVSVRP